MAQIAAWMDAVVSAWDNEALIERTAGEVKELCTHFSGPWYRGDGLAQLCIPQPDCHCQITATSLQLAAPILNPHHCHHPARGGSVAEGPASPLGCSDISLEGNNGSGWRFIELGRSCPARGKSPDPRRV